MFYERLFIVSPICEFHACGYPPEPTGRTIRILQGTLDWADELMKGRGCETKNVLDIARLPSKLDSGILAKIFGSRAWNDDYLSECLKAIEWCEAVALMPECCRVQSPSVDYIRKEASKRGRAVHKFIDIVGVSEGSFLKDLERIEEAVLSERSHRKIIMKGERLR